MQLYFTFGFFPAKYLATTLRLCISFLNPWPPPTVFLLRHIKKILPNEDKSSSH